MDLACSKMGWVPLTKSLGAFGQPKTSGTLNNSDFLPGALGSCGQLLLWEAGSCTTQHCFIQCLHLSWT